MEDYKGDQECFGGGDNCVRTIGEVFTTMHGAINTQVVKGVVKVTCVFRIDIVV